MSKQSLAEIRARLKAEKAKKENRDKKQGINPNIYPFWKMENDQEAVVRILRDKNPNNPNIFFVEKLEHRISVNGKDVTVPCLKMYGQDCPICEISQQHYKNGNKTEGKYYYRNRTSLVRVLVLKDPLPPDEEGKTYVGRCVNTQFSYQIMEVINDQIMTEGEDALENDPWDLENGYNFTIKKSKQGDYSTYAIGSKFSRKSSSVPAEYLDSIELIDLSTLLPKNPGIDAVQKLLNAHLSGGDADMEEGDEDSEEVKDTKPVLQTQVTAKIEKSSPVETDPEDESEDDDEDYEATIARIKARFGK
jgi:hypothetical protein